MAFWNRSPITNTKQSHRQQLEEYALQNKDNPFVRGLLLCSLAQMEANDLDGSRPYKDVNDGILNSAITVAWNITWIAMKANGLELLFIRGVVIRQPKVRAVLMFSLFVQFCLNSFLKGEGVLIDQFEYSALTLRTLCVALPPDEWDRVVADLTNVSCEVSREIGRDDDDILTKWKEQMHTFVPSYVLSFNKDSPQLQIINYPWVFQQLLAMLVTAAEG
jgi:hypothetical protein